MRSALLGCIVALLQMLPAITAQGPKSSLQLILFPDQITATSDGNFELYIKWVNHSNEVMMCGPNFWSSGVDEGYIYNIRTSDGKQIQRIPGKEKENSSPMPMLGICAVGPGRSVETSVGHLMSAFAMKQPGVYTVQVSRPDWAHPGLVLGASNIVAVTVKARE
jgi:hypothetical protein